MPCDTVSRAKLALKGDIVIMDTLRHSVESLGHRIRYQDAATLQWDTGSYNRATGIITEKTDASADKIRQSYAAELAKKTLGRFGWQVKTEEERGVR